ncbi:MAG: DNA-binding protein [Candidatus Eisenbacteria bacterium]|uniref:DNA-binding protein n=1 Tax=Eiseniibacteriota bacterium TaxID=2212470 RepID=A0A9D6L8Z7_UNCEI|nr:DNA-binding protein [Candidatus Eisenbacteria bacterium]MBI3540064.1 DNA-binding protein [Candidatus Eisenbacteria bacterium]
MQSRRTRYGYALRLDDGEEIVATLKAFAVAHGVRAGLISGLGACGETDLGFFVRATGEYVTRRFAGEHEIGALTGNFSELDGEPFPHCHAVIAGDDMVAHTGHLFRGVVTVTCEVLIVTDPDVMRRVRRPDLGFNPLELSG